MIPIFKEKTEYSKFLHKIKLYMFERDNILPTYGEIKLNEEAFKAATLRCKPMHRQIGNNRQLRLV
jgi:hypothetical protein